MDFGAWFVIYLSKIQKNFVCFDFEEMWLVQITKGQLISKCLFDVFNFFQKTNEKKSWFGDKQLSMIVR